MTVDPREAALRERFDVVEADVPVADEPTLLLRPASADALISEADFAVDERLPYWADVWPASVALATHELLENAVKYSKDGETTIRIDVSQTTPKTVRIMLRNRAEPQNIAAIREILDGVASAPDAFGYYQKLLDQANGATSPVSATQAARNSVMVNAINLTMTSKDQIATWKANRRKLVRALVLVSHT